MFQQRIQEVHGGVSKSEITNLDLEGCDATSLDGLTEDFDSLSSLSLANNKLNSLKAFPSLKTLTTLNLKGNHLEGGLDHLVHCDQLKSLDLSDNKFSSVDQLAPLKDCVALEILHLAGCPITSSEGYKEAVFDLIPHLKSVDGASRDASHSHEDGENHKNGDHVAVNGGGDVSHEEAGVDQLLRDDLEDDDEEYNPEGEEEEDDEIDEDDDEDAEEEEGDYEEEEGAEPRGVKRKHEQEDPLAHAEDSANGTH